MANPLGDKSSQRKKLKIRGYTILSKLGEGSYAKVYLGEFVSALPNQTPSPVIKLAVKVVETAHVPRDIVKKFLPRELTILSRISHPHIVHIHSILQMGQTFYIFMRFAEQGDLLEFIIKNGMIKENQARVWTRQIALALQYLHELNIAHRDMKCENILVTINYNVKLADFGFSRYTVDQTNRPVFCETYCGSLSYASPEILFGRPYNAKLSDIWSFGVIIFVMLNKSLPFEDATPKSMYENQLNHNFKFRSKVVGILSKEVKTLVVNLLEPDPMRRYRIDGVINSDWIAMDKRLIPLSPMELAAFTTALDNKLVPPALSNLKLNTKKSTAAVLDRNTSTSIVMIKSYKDDRPSASESAGFTQRR